MDKPEPKANNDKPGAETDNKLPVTTGWLLNFESSFRKLVDALDRNKSLPGFCAASAYVLVNWYYFDNYPRRFELNRLFEAVIVIGTLLVTVAYPVSFIIQNRFNYVVQKRKVARHRAQRDALRASIRQVIGDMHQVQSGMVKGTISRVSAARVQRIYLDAFRKLVDQQQRESEGGGSVTPPKS